MNLLFPQWQGAGNYPELRRGALGLASSRPALEWQQLEVAKGFSVAAEGINAYTEIAGQLEEAIVFLTRNRPQTLFTLGGDCSVELAPVSYLNTRYPNLGIVWFDAHADLQAPETSPSGDLHGMPLRLLLGEGRGVLESGLKQLLPSFIRPEQIVLVGVRALDQAEEEVVARLDLKALSAAEVNGQPSLITKTLQQSGWRDVYLHIDLDVLDPAGFSSLGWPESGGLTVASLVAALGALHRVFNVVGGGLTEYLPTAGDSEHADAVVALEVLDAWLG